MMAIEEILDTDATINMWYRESTLPKYIKMVIAKSKRRRLRKSVDRYYECILSADEMIRFFDSFINIYHDGDLNECQYVKPFDISNNHKVYYSRFKYNMYDNKNESLYGIISDMMLTASDKPYMNIRFNITNDDGSSYFDWEGTRLVDNSDKDRNTLLKYLNDIICNCIVEMIDDIISESERTLY